MDTTTLDMQVYAELKSIMGDTLNEVIKMFLENIPELIIALDTHIQNNEASQVFETAHRIKSSCGSIGAVGLAETAETIELTGREGSTENTATQLEVLKSQYREIKPFLESELTS